MIPMLFYFCVDNECFMNRFQFKTKKPIPTKGQASKFSLWFYEM